ncbi:rhomboid family intramembrane serine protease [Bacillus massilinigeriensis]|uniref:rhomboid family intramembrane serine protease n=1 Tax=Bacillus mediterraneensis TaxID=1805474 RepID=UPI0008F8F101|nr:rhomboid family intramembrane serine protease [Bacillus mediterraneensis]
MAGREDYRFRKTAQSSLIESTLNEAQAKVREEAAEPVKKPRFTYLFIGISILVFLLMTGSGGSTNPETLISFGAKSNIHILLGEWWRFLTPVFIHIGVLHLLMNCIALFYIGPVVEQIFGRIRYFFIFLFAGFAGVLGSFLYSPVLSAGASGAIMGCFGALLYFGLKNRELFFRSIGPSLLSVLVVNLAFGFTVQGVDNAGHIGGLLGGFAAAAIVGFPGILKRNKQLVFLIATISAVIGFLSYGNVKSMELVDKKSLLWYVQDKIKQGKYADGEKVMKNYIKIQGASPETLFLLSITEKELNKHEEAKSHLQKVLELDPEFHEAFYLLGNLYLEEQNIPRAMEYAEIAVKLQPRKAEYQKLVEYIDSFSR